MLEPCEGKLSCTVLRGEGGSNTADLPDNPLDQGALGAYSAHALVTGAATGRVGDIVDAGDLGKFTIEEYYDGGTQVLLGEPLRFDKDNIAQWKDKF